MQFDDGPVEIAGVSGEADELGETGGNCARDGKYYRARSRIRHKLECADVPTGVSVVTQFVFKLPLSGNLKYRRAERQLCALTERQPARRWPPATSPHPAALETQTEAITSASNKNILT